MSGQVNFRLVFCTENCEILLALKRWHECCGTCTRQWLLTFDFGETNANWLIRTVGHVHWALGFELICDRWLSLETLQQVWGQFLRQVTLTFVLRRLGSVWWRLDPCRAQALFGFEIHNFLHSGVISSIVVGWASFVVSLWRFSVQDWTALLMHWRWTITNLVCRRWYGSLCVATCWFSAKVAVLLLVAWGRAWSRSDLQTLARPTLTL